MKEEADLGVVSREAARRIKEVTFPFEYHAQVLGEHFSQRAAVRSLRGYLIAAAIVAFLVLQAALGSWRLALLALQTIPFTILGCLLAGAVAGSCTAAIGRDDNLEGCGDR